MIEIRKWKKSKHFAVWNDTNLVCICEYKKGAKEVVKLLEKLAQFEFEVNLKQENDNAHITTN